MEMIKYTQLGVYGVLVKNDKVLLIKKARGPHTGKWDFPGVLLSLERNLMKPLRENFGKRRGLLV